MIMKRNGDVGNWNSNKQSLSSLACSSTMFTLPMPTSPYGTLAAVFICECLYEWLVRETFKKAALHLGAKILFFS